METEKTTKVEQREKEEPQKEEVVEEKKKPFSLKKNRASSEQKFQPTTRIE